MGCPGSKSYRASAPKPCTGTTLLETAHEQQNSASKTSSLPAEPNAVAGDAGEPVHEPDSEPQIVESGVQLDTNCSNQAVPDAQHCELATQLEAITRSDLDAILAPDTTAQDESATQLGAIARADVGTDCKSNKTAIDSEAATEQQLKGVTAKNSRGEEEQAAIEIDGDERGLPIHIGVGGNVSIGCCRLGCWV